MRPLIYAFQHRMQGWSCVPHHRASASKQQARQTGRAVHVQPRRVETRDPRILDPRPSQAKGEGLVRVLHVLHLPGAVLLQRVQGAGAVQVDHLAAGRGAGG